MTNMKDQTFGLELEFFGMSRALAVQVIARTIGGEVRSGDAVKDGRRWQVVRDGSIVAESGEACEMVTPILKYDDIEMLQEVIRELRKAGAKVNSSCGIHVHVGADKHNAKSLKNLVNIMYQKQDMLYRAIEMLPNRANRWAKKIPANVVERMQKANSKKLDSVARAWYNDDPSRHTAKYDDSRYHGLNLHSVWYTGTVEFRLFNATTHAGKVKAYIQFCLAVSAQAINSKATSAIQTVSDNEKFTFRGWLIRLGLNGDEFKTCRQHMMANLKGNGSVRYAN